MFCPKCSQERKATNTIYCTGCGFRLTEVASLVDENVSDSISIDAADISQISPRKRGLRLSFFIFLFTFILFTTGGLLQAFFGLNTRYFVIFSLILIFVGFFRGIYALAFESGKTDRIREVPSANSPNTLAAPETGNLALPEGTDTASSFTAPASVTDSTTRELVHRKPAQ